MINPGLRDKVALVTGANHGIGEAAAKALAEQGASVFVTYFIPPPAYGEEELSEARAAGIRGDAFYRAEQSKDGRLVTEAIRNSGGRAAALAADLRDTASVANLFEACERELGPVDILVNNHAHCVPETFDPQLAVDEPGGVRRVSVTEIDAHFQANARAVALLMDEFATRLMSRSPEGGRIVNVSTDAAHAHIANVHYAASKHAIESYSRSAALELGRYNITVNVVAPGPIQTGYIGPNDAAAIEEATPLGRLGTPKDVADVIVFLASDQARWLTGQLLYVGGGWRIGQ